MKKILMLLIVTALLSVQSNAQTKTSATVNVYQGVAIFTDCNPVMSYDILGDLKIGSSGGFGNDSYNSQREAAIKKLKKEYPTADGILISFKENGACMATAIKFK
jgi:hypothetical protein